MKMFLNFHDSCYFYVYAGLFDSVHLNFIICGYFNMFYKYVLIIKKCIKVVLVHDIFFTGSQKSLNDINTVFDHYTEKYHMWCFSTKMKILKNPLK